MPNDNPKSVRAESAWHHAVIAALPHDISDEVIAGWMSDPNALKDAFRAAIGSRPNLKPWKRIRIGVFADLRGLMTAVTASGVRVDREARNILTHLARVDGRAVDVDLVKLSAEALGFSGTTTYGAVVARARKFGLDLCPPGAGLALRLAYLEQPPGERLFLATEAGHDGVFRVENFDGGLWLVWDGGIGAAPVRAGWQFVFRSP